MTINPKRIQAIFLGALELSEPATRWAFLDRECAGDAALRQRVEALLAAHEATGFDVDLSESMAGATLELPQVSRAGTLLAGRYKLVESIGEGGMGSVWLAEQKEPIKRKVAIKLIKAGMDSKQILARFEAERQALAVMDHPNIAKVLDGGVTEQGRPFFAMELVKGVPLTEYCDQVQLPIKERMELFVQVCAAVQHAHQKGIIHRDLKPSNLLVTEHDGKPIVKVIDFGLAKALTGSQSLTDLSLHTAWGAVVGTPLYMAPEQLGTSALDVDTRADLYSLGVILYELLTGTTPIERQKLKQAAWEEMCRLIREEEPPRPSTRLSSSDALPSVAARRHVEPARLTRLVRGELDWIIMKSLEKDRNRRYESAMSLGLDIQRYLAGEAVTAAPPSRIYRLRKFVRRNRGPVFAGLLLFFSLSAGIGGTTFGLYRANQSAKRESTARKVAEDRQREAEHERTRAEQRERQAIDAVRKFAHVVAEDHELKNNPQFDSLRRQLLNEPLDYFQSLRGALQATPTTKLESLRLLAFAANEHANLAGEIGDQQKAIQAYMEARLIIADLARQYPDDPTIQKDLAGVLGNLGLLLERLGRLAEAKSACEEALKIRQRITRDDPSMENQHFFARALINVGKVAWGSSDLKVAFDSFSDARKIFETMDPPGSTTPILRDYSQVLNNLALYFWTIGNLDEALVLHRKAFELRDTMMQREPSNTEAGFLFAQSCENLAVLLKEQKNDNDAIAINERGVAVMERLVSAHPAINAWRAQLASLLSNLGRIYHDSGAADRANDCLAKASLHWQKLVAENPGVHPYQMGLAHASHQLGAVEHDQGRFAEAIARLEKSREILSRLTNSSPELLDAKASLADVLRSLGLQYEQQGNGGLALDTYEQALSIQTALEATKSNDMQLAQDLADTLTAIGRVHLAAKRNEMALECFRRSLAILSKRVHAESPDQGVLDKLATCQHSIGLAQEQSGDLVEAIATYNTSAGYWKKLVELQPKRSFVLSSYAGVLNDIGSLEIDTSQFDSAMSHLQEAVKFSKQSLVISPHDYQVRQFLKTHYYNLGRIAGETANVDLQSEVRRETAALSASDPSFTELDRQLARAAKEPDVLKPSELVRLASRAAELGRHSFAVKLHRQALAADPALANDDNSRIRFKAACAAVLAASLGDFDGTELNEAARSGHRRQALDWLRLELDSLSAKMETAPIELQEQMRALLKRWLNHPDLLGVSAHQALEKLSPDEQQEWNLFWEQVKKKAFGNANGPDNAFAQSIPKSLLFKFATGQGLGWLALR